MDQAWTLAIISGVLIEVVGLFVGYLVLNVSGKTLGLIIGNILSLLISFVIQFLFMNLDYARTERVQFEDDDYYYYVKAVPKKQTISCVADLSHETIHGITQMTAVYTGTVTVSYSFDGTNYTDVVDMATFLATDCATLYSSAQANKKIWFKFMIDGDSSSLTNFIITYKND